MIKWLDTFLRDPIAVRKARLGVIGSVIIILPLLYFGFWNQLSFDSLFNASVGVLGVLSLMSVWIAKIEIGTIVYDITIETHTELKDVLKKNKEKMLRIKDVDLAVDTVTAFNEKEQATANKMLTVETIQDLEWKKRDRMVRNKNTDVLEKKIEVLKENPLFDKTHIPFDVRDLLSSDLLASTKKKRKNKKRGKYNPKTDGKKVEFFTSTLKFFGVGANAGVAFILNDLKVIFTYYLMLSIAVLLASLAEAKGVKEKTETRFFDDQRDKNSILTHILKMEGSTNGNVQVDNKRVIVEK